MLKKRVSLTFCILIAVLASVTTIFAFEKFCSSSMDGGQAATKESSLPCEVLNIKRFKSKYKFINPILSVESANESDRYSGLKQSIDKYLGTQKDKGVTSASIYFKKFNTGEWFSINGNEQYDPGSLLKAGVLITYLLMGENDPTLINKEVVYHGQPGFVFPIEHYQADTVIEGHKYLIKDLLRYMIRFSDNRATVFLEDHMDTTTFKKEFTDLGIPAPKFQNPNFTLNARQYSAMFNALYNAGYLRKNASEEALSLLGESVFKEGLLKKLPSATIAAHKYGEYGNDVSHELHESGIIYMNNNAYLVTIMTRGTDWNGLSSVIADISRMVYDHEATMVN